MNSIGVDKKVHLGDIVGFGPKPSETLALTLQEFNYIVEGQHDLAVIDEEESWGFAPQDKFAIEWTREKLSKSEKEVLDNLTFGHIVGDILFAHTDHERIIHSGVSFVGGTHIPMCDNVKPKFARTGVAEFQYETKGNSVINVGSVGQPKDGDSRATYGIYDTETGVVTLYKVPYAVDRTVGLMQRAGFSENAWQRLLFGR
jgi:diadenosine tetraphosphatase ApaH/serine/threonine PP2A family protein phosphatase